VYRDVFAAALHLVRVGKEFPTGRDRRRGPETVFFFPPSRGRSDACAHERTFSTRGLNSASELRVYLFVMHRLGRRHL